MVICVNAGGGRPIISIADVELCTWSRERSRHATVATPRINAHDPSRENDRISIVMGTALAANLEKSGVQENAK
jgi:hypothetical protein